MSCSLDNNIILLQINTSVALNYTNLHITIFYVYTIALRVNSGLIWHFTLLCRKDSNEFIEKIAVFSLAHGCLRAS